MPTIYTYAGTSTPYGLVYGGNYLYMPTYTGSLVSVLKISITNPTSYSTVTFTNDDGYHGTLEYMIYNSNDGKLYALWRNNGRVVVSATNAGFTSYTDIVNDTDTAS